MPTGEHIFLKPRARLSIFFFFCFLFLSLFLSFLRTLLVSGLELPVSRKIASISKKGKEFRNALLCVCFVFCAHVPESRTHTRLDLLMRGTVASLQFSLCAPLRVFWERSCVRGGFPAPTAFFTLLPLVCRVVCSLSACFRGGLMPR